MDYKEKYNTALERARKIHHETEFDYEKGMMEEIFPELKEPNGEKIRKELIAIFSVGAKVNAKTGDIPDRDIVAWLEKQGEQPTDKVESKFKVGDWIIFNENHNSAYQVDRIDNYRYYLRHYLGGTLSVPCNSELIRLWTIQDAKNGDIVYYECHDTKHLFIVKSVGETKDHVEGHFWYNITRNECEIWDGRLPYSNIASMWDAMPATKEQRDLLFEKMKEAGYEWDGKKKELKKIESKTLDADKVIEWIERNASMFWESPCNPSRIVEQFKKDF